MPSALTETHRVVVVGAGLAGLSAARLLQNHFPDIIVLEATQQPGGRVRQAIIGLLLPIIYWVACCNATAPDHVTFMKVHDIAPWPVEAGPQFVHGANSSLKASHLPG